MKITLHLYKRRKFVYFFSVIDKKYRSELWEFRGKKIIGMVKGFRGDNGSEHAQWVDSLVCQMLERK